MLLVTRFSIPALITTISYFLSANYAEPYGLFRFDRDAILHGEVWRILTGNFTHADLNHWLINMFGLWLLWWIYVDSKEKQYKMTYILFITSIGTCIGLFLFEPQLKLYVGLSGALHGLFAAGIVMTFKNDAKIQLLLAILLCIKLIYEQLTGPLPGSEKMISVPVVVNSHLYGAITGFIAGYLPRMRDLLQGQNNT